MQFNNLSLSKVILGSSSHGLGKYQGLTGKDVQSLPVEEQKKYVLRDAELVIQLSKHNVLDAMKSISEITGLDFEKVGRTGLSIRWAAIFDNMTVASSYYRTTEKLELQYIGTIYWTITKRVIH